MANNTIGIDRLGQAIAETLEIYGEEVTRKVNEAGDRAMKTLVQKTKATAPVVSGDFKKNIASKEIQGPRGNNYVWYVKPPHYRLTHLIVHGHALPNGGRTKANPFLQNALDKALHDYEEEVECVIREGGANE